MSFYVTLPSNVQTNDQENKVSHYRTYLQTPLYLYGLWEVAIVKIIYTNTLEEATNVFYIYTDFIEDQILSNTRAQILEIIGNGAGRDEIVSLQINNPHYVTLSKSIISDIWIGTKDGQGEYVKFKNNSRFIVKLHFRPKRL